MRRDLTLTTVRAVVFGEDPDLADADLRQVGQLTLLIVGAEGKTMAVKLHKRAFEHVESLILSGMYPIDGRDAWSEHQPSAQKENEYIRQHDYSEYARCHLGIDDEHDEDTKGRYKFPYGDFEQVHRCGLLAAEPPAGQQKYYDIELAVAHLHGMLEALSKQRESTSK